MSILVGYDQNIRHDNDKPAIKNDIYALSPISTSRYNPNEKATADIESFLKRPVKYYFNVVTKSKKETTAFKHSYYFDKQSEAIEEHRKLKVKWYDQLTKPFLDKLEHSSQLSIPDQVKLNTIIERLSLK